MRQKTFIYLIFGIAVFAAAFCICMKVESNHRYHEIEDGLKRTEKHIREMRVQLDFMTKRMNNR